MAPDAAEHAARLCQRDAANRARLHDVAVHVSGSRSWVSMPARPMLDANGRALRDDSRKIRYAQPVRWSTHGLASTFGQKVVALVRAAHPDALGEAER